MTMGQTPTISPLEEPPGLTATPPRPRSLTPKPKPCKGNHVIGIPCRHVDDSVSSLVNDPVRSGSLVDYFQEHDLRYSFLATAHLRRHSNLSMENPTMFTCQGRVIAMLHRNISSVDAAGGLGIDRGAHGTTSSSKPQLHRETMLNYLPLYAGRTQEHQNS